jgi:hypothetical protein
LPKTAAAEERRFLCTAALVPAADDDPVAKLQNEGRKPVVQTPTADCAVQTPLSAAIERLPKLVNDNEALLRRGRYLTTDIMIEIGAQPYYISIDRGRISAFQRGPKVMKSWSFAVRGSEDAWRKFWEPFPPPHFHDIFALAKQGAFRIDGDYQPLITNLLYFKELLAAPRALQAKVP